jgi:hypothetical protein
MSSGAGGGLKAGIVGYWGEAIKARTFHFSTVNWTKKLPQ